MPAPFNLSDVNYSILKKACSIFDVSTEIYVFGSRAKKNNRKYSDLDLILKSDRSIPEDLKQKFKNNLEESDLTIRVDVLDWSETDEEFRNLIDSDKKLFK